MTTTILEDMGIFLKQISREKPMRAFFQEDEMEVEVQMENEAIYTSND